MIHIRGMLKNIFLMGIVATGHIMRASEAITTLSVKELRGILQRDAAFMPYEAYAAALVGTYGETELKRRLTIFCFSCRRATYDRGAALIASYTASFPSASYGCHFSQEFRDAQEKRAEKEHFSVRMEKLRQGQSVEAVCTEDIGGQEGWKAVNAWVARLEKLVVGDVSGLVIKV